MIQVVFISLLLLGVGVGSFNVKKECIPKTYFDLEWEGSRVDLIFWMPEDRAWSPNSPSPLTLLLEFHGSSMPEDYDRIRLNLTGVSVDRTRNRKNNRMSFNLTDPLVPGWNVLNFSSESGIELRNDFGAKILSLEMKKVINKMRIEGLYFVVNCHQSPLLWPVDGSSEVVIPYLASEPGNEFTFFSNGETNPILSIEESKKILLGWDGNDPADQIRFNEQSRRPLPASREHKISINCTEKSNVACQILVGDNGKVIKEFTLDRLPNNFSVSVGPFENLYVSHQVSMFSYGHEAAPQGEYPECGTAEACIVAIPVLIIIIIVILLVGFIVYKKKIFPRRDITKNDEEFAQPLIQNHQINSTYMVEETRIPLQDELMNAIERNRLEDVESLLTATSIKEEHRVRAHYLGRKEILENFRKMDGREEEKPNNGHIKKVYEELERGINDVFEAAKEGRYKKTSGVRVKLEDHSLPGTITDERGRSILHYMVEFRDNKPLWEREDIVDFLNSGNYYINALDHLGNTALHILAFNDSENFPVRWDGEELDVREVLKDMVTLLLEKGADPNMKNSDNKTPVIIAQDKGHLKLTDFLEEECAKFRDSKKAKCSEDFVDLVEAVSKGDEKRVCDLLQAGVVILPMSAEKDPLVEALQNNQRNIVFLLLGAGAPICNRCIDDLTPLDTAHNTLELPGCYAAIMRKTFYDHLATERGKIQNEELCKIISNHMENIKEQGTEAEGIIPKAERDKENQKYSKKVRKLLVAAASSGLPLTCLLLGQRDVFLHKMPSEENPLSKALENKYHETQIALCRDLGITPFTFDNSGALPGEVTDDMYNKEMKILDQHGNSGTRVDCLSLVEVDSNHLKLIAMHDLVVLLDIIVKKHSINIDQVVEEFSRSTIMHIAAMYGSIRVIEYLVYKRASLELKTIGNFTAAHLAAIRGHKECFYYIQEWMKRNNRDMVNAKCDLGLKASQIMSEYEKLCKTCDNPLMTHTDALVVMNENGDDKKVHEILYRKGKAINHEGTKLKGFNDLVQYTMNNLCGEEDMKEIEEKVTAVTEKLKCKSSEFIPGRFILMGPLAEKNEVLDITHVDFRYEIEKKTSKEDAITVITDTFPQCVKDAMKNFRDESQKFSLAPPFLTEVGKGVQIRWVCYDGSLKLLTSYIVPTVAIDDSNTRYYYDKQKLVKSEHEKDQKFYSNLEGYAREAWLISRMLRKLTQECWWSPTFKTQYYQEPWHTWSLGVPGLSETKQKKLFQREEDMENLSPSQIIMETYKDIVERNDDKKWVPKMEEECTEKEKLSICGILQYLDSLKSETARETQL